VKSLRTLSPFQSPKRLNDLISRRTFELSGPRFRIQPFLFQMPNIANAFLGFMPKLGRP